MFAAARHREARLFPMRLYSFLSWGDRNNTTVFFLFFRFSLFAYFFVSYRDPSVPCAGEFGEKR